MINRVALITIAVVVFYGCANGRSGQSNNTKGKGKLHFTELSHNFGELKQGDVVGHRFAVVNKGQYPVVIQKVKHRCGCTDAIYSKKPLNANDTAFIEVIFDTKGWHGRQVKQVVIVANDSVKKHELLVWASIK